MACDFLNCFEAPTKGRTKKHLKNWSNAEGFQEPKKSAKVVGTLKKTYNKYDYTLLVVVFFSKIILEIVENSMMILLFSILFSFKI